MLRQQVIKLASEVPELRRYLVPLLRGKQAAENPDRWDEFLKERYEGGRKQVPNPNPKTRDTYKTVALSTALQDEPTMKRVREEYAEWAKKQNDPEAAKKEILTIEGPVNRPTLEFLSEAEVGDFEKEQEVRRRPLIEYQRVLFVYSNAGFKFCNRDLRKEQPDNFSEFSKTFVPALDKAFAHPNAKLNRVVKVMRGVSVRNQLSRGLDGGTLQVGYEIEDKGFVSTTLSLDVAKGFHDESGTGVVLHITVPKGTKAIWLGPPPEENSNWALNPKEQELLLNRGTKMRVTGMNKEKRIIELEVIE